jgi:flagellin
MAISSSAKVATNIDALHSYDASKNISKKVGTVALHLSAGVGVGSADDPASFTIAKTMQAKSRAVAQAINNVGDARSVLAIAGGGLMNVNETLLTVKEKVAQATDGTLGADERGAIAAQVNDSLNEIGDIMNQTKFADAKLLDGTFVGKEFQVGLGVGDVIKIDIPQSISSAGLGLELTGGASTPAAVPITGSNVTELLAPAAADSSVSRIDNAINLVSNQMQSLGSLSNRLDSRENMLGIAQTNIDSAISRMYDTDMAKEQMEAMKSQILQNTSVAQLAQANATPQQYLQLFSS